MLVNEFKKVIEYLKSKPKILITGHIRPDGDALGSVLGLKRILNDNGFNAIATGLDPIPRQLNYLIEKDEEVTIKNTCLDDYQCLFVLDCGDWGRVEKNIADKKNNFHVINIDHHASSEGIGNTILNNPAASSTGELVMELAMEAGWKINNKAADALWVSMVTDTGSFSYTNTSAKVLRYAAKCIEYGANIEQATLNIYQSVSKPERVLQGIALERLTFFEKGKLAETWLTSEDFKVAGASIDAAQDIVNIVRDTAGVEIALFFYEITEKEEVKISVRTKHPHDAIRLVKEYAGGGHKRAAGGIIKKNINEAKENVVKKALEVYFSEGKV